MKNDEDPSYSQELAGMDPWDHSFWLSRAYLEASVQLCVAMVEGDFSSQYSSSRVILHIARQGLELFFKAAIGALGESVERFGHDLDKLHLAYVRAYPNQSFHFQVPARFQVSLNEDLFPDALKEFHGTLDQRHRYAVSKRGESFATPEIFDPQTTKEELDDLRSLLQIIEWAKIRPLLASQAAL